MRIGMVSRTIPPFDRGGIQIHVRNLALALSKLGHEVHLFISGESMTLDNVQIHPLSTFSTPGLTLGYYLSIARSSASMVKRYDLDILHGHSMYAFGLALRETRPFIDTIHGTQVGELHSQIASGIFNLNHLLTDSASIYMEGYASKKAHAIIAVSEMNKREIIEHYSPPPEKIHVVPNGVWVDEFTSSDLSRNEIIFIGRLHERKGIDRLLKVLPEIVKELPTVKLVIIGSGELEKRLMTMAQTLEVTEHIEFAGRLSEAEKRARLAHARLLVMPSIYEGFGIVMIEGMAAGLPVVATPTGAVQEVIRDGENGIITTHADLAKAIITILSDEKKLKAMGKNARATVETYYDWSMVAVQTVAVYEQCLGQVI